MDFQCASLIQGEAAQYRADRGVRLVEEAEAVRPLPYVLPLRLQSRVTWGVVVHQEPSGGAVPTVHQKKAGEAGELVIGAL